MDTKNIRLIIIAAAVLIIGSWVLWLKINPSADKNLSNQEIETITVESVSKNEQEKGNEMLNNKTLVIYFSRANENYNVGTVDVGNTALLAQVAIEELKADSFEIVPTKPYPTDYQETIEQATREREQGVRPEYIDDVDLSAYETIYLGYPIWWGDLPMIVYHFVENHDWTGKTVIPFNTHEGSGNSGTYQILRELMPGATLKGEGYNMTGTQARTPAGQEQMRAWVREIVE